MLSSLNSPHEEEGGGGGDQQDHLNPSPNLILSPAHVRQLLISCAELVQHSTCDTSAARRAASLISTAASPCGDAADRLAHQFARALALRIDRLPPALPSSDAATYLTLNQVTPFLRFAHLTANQAILEAVEGRRFVHILDFDTSHGVQWPPLLQAIADRSDPADLPSIRITGTGDDIDVLRRTGDRLRTFAHSIGLPFQFYPLLLPIATTSSSSNIATADHPSSSTGCSSFSPSSFHVHPSETLAVNCVHFLHKMIKDDDDGMREIGVFLKAVKAMGPAVVTVAEREAKHGSVSFLERFMEALDYYSALFDSLEATLPPGNRDRVAVEQAWLGREIAGVVAGEERHGRFEQWEAAMRAVGFANIPLSPFALSQAKLLLRLHYPSEGYQLQVMKDSFFLGWQNKPLFSVSSWH